jgi:plasmid segregation protein ParM
MRMIIGIDAGNNEVKVVGPLGTMKFPSAIGAYRERNLTNAMTKHDMIVEYKGRKVFAGTLAEESMLGGAIMGESKAHEDALLRVLIALHRYSNSDLFEVVVGQPIGKHTEEEKQAIKTMLLGEHKVIINGDIRRFRVTQCQVAAEGGAAFWSAPSAGTVRIIDVGSGTVNCASLNDQRYLDKGSFSLPFGMNTVGTDNIEEIARGIVAHTTAKQWQRNDSVLLVGGVAIELLEAMRKYYPKADVIMPKIKLNHGVKSVGPIYANAIGFYNIGKAVYGE